jgi:fucose permease
VLTSYSLGMNDASYGALLPFIQPHYDLSYLVASLVFAFPFIGYGVASFVNHGFHTYFGQRGIAAVGPATRIISYIVISFAPPFPAVCAMLVLIGLGIGLIDAGWNAWVGDLENPNQLLGIMHGLYGAGATIAPVIGTSMVTKYDCDWNQYFYVPLGLCVFELGFGLWAFWDQDGAVFKAKMDASTAIAVEEGGSGKVGLRGALSEKVTVVVAAFLFMYVGAEGTILITSYFAWRRH